ncbi:MAG: lysophospholipid acyltransferase family protein [Leptospiraceae bacterium]|nr:lysophospholipid acyltransferase family protein [Leptospiraceae bacterium]MDW8307546.1 lysophospholipid acyltransferase family protein [Leptospiraceae bacterium]
MEILFLLPLVVFVNFFPFAWLHGLARFLVFVLNPVLGSLKKRVRENLSFAYPDLQGKERERFIRENLAHNLRVFLEVMQMHKFSSSRFVDRHILYEEEDIKILEVKDRSVIGVEGHYGNWEIAIPFYARHGFRVHFVAKHLSNPYVDRLLHLVRQKYGGQIYYMEESQKLVKLAREGAILGLVADQDAGGEGVFVNYFSRPASTFKGPALLALVGQARLFLATFVYLGKGKYRLKTKLLVDRVKREDYGSVEEAIAKLTDLWVSALEEAVRQNPQQYFWVHRRWKSKPTYEAQKK